MVRIRAKAPVKRETAGQIRELAMATETLEMATRTLVMETETRELAKATQTRKLEMKTLIPELKREVMEVAVEVMVAMAAAETEPVMVMEVIPFISREKRHLHLCRCGMTHGTTKKDQVVQATVEPILRRHSRQWFAFLRWFVCSCKPPIRLSFTNEIPQVLSMEL